MFPIYPDRIPFPLILDLTKMGLEVWKILNDKCLEACYCGLGNEKGLKRNTIFRKHLTDFVQIGIRSLRNDWTTIDSLAQR